MDQEKIFFFAGAGFLGLAALGYKSYYSNSKWRNYSYNYPKLQNDLEKLDGKGLDNVLLVGKIESQDKSKSYNQRGPFVVEATYEEKKTQSWSSWLWSWVGQGQMRTQQSLRTECKVTEDFTMTSDNGSITVKDMKEAHTNATEKSIIDGHKFVMELTHIYNVKKDGKEHSFYVLAYGTTLYALGEAKLEKKGVVFRPREIGSSISSIAFKEKVKSWIFCLLVIGGIVSIGIGLILYYRKQGQGMNDRQRTNDKKYK
uniref:Uncharacterized protein n=1 Tax=Amphimedon queenslandica TaxID=400682 RepID=A0A1X7TCP2_AMPQE